MSLDLQVSESLEEPEWVSGERVSQAETVTEKPYKGLKASACSRDRKEARGAPVKPTAKGRSRQARCATMEKSPGPGREVEGPQRVLKRVNSE